MNDDLRSSEPGDAAPSASLRDVDVQAIAARLVQEHRAPPPAIPDQQRSRPDALSPRDEERIDAAVIARLGVPPETTLRAERETGPEADGADPGDADSGRREIMSALARNRRRFLDTELAVGHTMLNAAAVTQMPAVRDRRVARAGEAHDEVARHLSPDAHPALTGVDWTALAEGLAGLRARLDAAG